MQISFVMLIFLLFSDQISEGAKVSEGGKLPKGGAPCLLWKKARAQYIGGYPQCIGGQGDAPCLLWKKARAQYIGGYPEYIGGQLENVVRERQ